MSRSFKDINEMVRRFKESPSSADVNVSELKELEFIYLIYSLDTGKFDIVGLSETSFLRYFLTSGQTDQENWAMDIANNLPYTNEDFIKLL